MSEIRHRTIQTNGISLHIAERDLSGYATGENSACVGIDLHLSDQLARLVRWQNAYSRVFEDLRKDPRINTQCENKPYLHNGTYPTPDAEVYAAMILDYQPECVVEIGAGFSTRIARHATRLLSGGCQITAIDPEPRTDIAADVDVLTRRRVEEIPREAFPLGRRALLFIDSSHVARARGDVPYLYNVLLPSVPAGTLVHVHDIFLPYDYPFQYQGRLYTEQYVLQALLAHSERYRVVFATHCLSRQHPGVMRAAFGDIVGTDDRFYGASFWFEVR